MVPARWPDASPRPRCHRFTGTETPSRRPPSGAWVSATRAGAPSGEDDAKVGSVDGVVTGQVGAGTYDAPVAEHDGQVDAVDESIRTEVCTAVADLACHIRLIKTVMSGKHPGSFRKQRQSGFDAASAFAADCRSCQEFGTRLLSRWIAVVLRDSANC